MGVWAIFRGEAPNGSSLSGTEIVAVVAVASTALLLDFVGFRAAQRRKARLADKSQKVTEGDQKEPPLPNGTAKSTDNDGEGRKVGAVVEVRLLPAGGAGGHVTRALVLSACVLTAAGCHRIGAISLARSSVTIGCLVAYLPHLLRSSKYIQDPSLGCTVEKGDRKRPVTDMLVWTSLVYLAPAVYGLMLKQYGIAFLLVMTTVGSSLFHLMRETKFFNLDNVFATSLLLITVWGFFLAVRDGIWWYMVTMGLGGPVAVFFIVRCGMPGLVCKHSSGRGFCRKSNPDYDFFHMLWHLASGLGLEAGGGWFSRIPGLPVVPTVSLVVSALGNFIGNYVGVMPLD